MIKQRARTDITGMAMALYSSNRADSFTSQVLFMMSTLATDK